MPSPHATALTSLSMVRPDRKNVIIVPTTQQVQAGDANRGAEQALHRLARSSARLGCGAWGRVGNPVDAFCYDSSGRWAGVSGDTQLLLARRYSE